ncbi:hypothetical protein [Alteraurantiacibacter palmitatis]|uniref:Acid phosphatase n=1 Tax=Alteraurantiacibacter palmitatis TaxID=2054628 RepID=A0ABV7E9A5_9SPHN
MITASAATAARFLAVLLAGASLQACATNPLAAIDGPYIPPSQRERAVPPPPPLAVPTPAPNPAPVQQEVAAPVPAPAVADAPTPAPSATDAAPALPIAPASPYAAFHRFVLERLAAPAGRPSMLLADPPALSPELLTCNALPPAVLIDLDPAGGLLPLGTGARTDSALPAFLGDLRQRGITIYWISGHGPGEARAIRNALVETRLDPAGEDPLIVNRFARENKQSRRRALATTDCLLAILGDERADFDDLYEYVRSLEVAGELEVHIGRGWFLAPPPLSPVPPSPTPQP